MKSKITFLMILSTLLFLLCFETARSEIDIKSSAWQKVKNSGKKNCHVFLFFGDAKKQEAKTMLASLDEVKKEITKTKKVDIIEVAINSTEERELINFFKIRERRFR